MNDDILFLSHHARKLHITLSDTQLAQFDTYKNELLLWNDKTNFISEKSAREIVTRHFLDSLTALPFIINPSARIIDVGSGAGFPGLPLKIAQPSFNLFLLEANRKKVSFLKHMIRLLHLSSVTVLHDRVENIITNNLWKETFDVLISRATLKLPEFMSLGEILLAPQGQWIAWKGPKTEEEISRCAPPGQRSEFSQWIQHDIEADFTDIPRKIIIGKK